MLVYKKDKLKREVIPVSKELFKLRLNHLDSKMSIETDFDINKPSSGVYRVFKEVDGKYVIYQEFLPASNKSKIENFKDAIDFFESQILEELREKPQNTQTPPNQQQDEPETFTKTPEIGDIVMVQNTYGRVVDVDGTNVKMKTLTKEEAMKILREQRNQLVQESIDGVDSTLKDVVDSLNFELGGDISTIKEYDASKFKFTIFEVKPPIKPQEPDDDIPPQDPPDEQEPQPDNVIDPFEDENDSSGENDSDNESTEDETENDEQKGTEEQKGDKGSGEEGDEESGEEEESIDSDDGSDSEDGEKPEEENDLEEDDFGSDGGASEPDLEKIMENVIKEIEKGKKLEDIKINNDIEAIERALNITRRKLKNQFKNPSLAIIGIGNEQIFNTQNKERIIKAINKIFE